MTMKKEGRERYPNGHIKPLPGASKRYMETYNKKHPGKIKAYQTKYRKENNDKINTKQRKRSLIKRKNEWARIEQLIQETQDNIMYNNYTIWNCKVVYN